MVINKHIPSIFFDEVSGCDHLPQNNCSQWLHKLKLLESLLDNVNAYIFAKDLQGKYIYANQRVASLFRVDASEIIGKDDSHFFDLSDHSTLLENDQSVLKEQVTLESEEVNYIQSSNSRRVYKSTKSPLYDDSGKLIGLYGISTDITELYQLKEQYQALATQDHLTSLYNRRYFEEQANSEFYRAKRHNTPLALISLDIDHFKSINDNYGHAAGDKVLVAFAQNLKKQLREYDIVARIGGEEFSIILPNTTMKEALVVAERIRLKQQSLMIEVANNSYITVTVSTGATQKTVTHQHFDEMLLEADKALYQAKTRGRNKVVSFNDYVARAC